MITIISGTNRPHSRTRIVAGYYKQLLEKLHQESHILDLEELPPQFLFSAMYHNAGKDAGFNHFLKLINASEKFVFVVPEYNGSLPGVLKAFIDGLDFPDSFGNKKCALVGLSSGSMAGTLALSHLTDILNYMGMHVLALKTRLPYIDRLLMDGKLTDHAISGLLETQAKALIEF